MSSHHQLVAVCVAAASLVAVSAAHAIPAGTGVRGTVSASWGGVTGSPITSWTGHAHLAFDPSGAARRATIAAVPAHGEALRPLTSAQVQAVRVTSLAGDKAETVLCSDDGPDGLVDREATATSSVAGIADGRIAYEILRPSVDLLTGTGTIHLRPYVHLPFEGHWLTSRFVLPGRWAPAGSWPCAGDGAPATRLPRIIAPHGQGAVPRAVSDWLADGDDWPLRRTRSGWRVMMDTSSRVTFSESPFGPQTGQGMDVRVTSSLYLAGSLPRLGARCRVPVERIARARSAPQAVRIARKAGLTRTTYAGRRYLPAGWPSEFSISGPRIDTQGHAPCGKGTYRIRHHVPRG